MLSILAFDSADALVLATNVITIVVNTNTTARNREEAFHTNAGASRFMGSEPMRVNSSAKAVQATKSDLETTLHSP